MAYQLFPSLLTPYFNIRHNNQTTVFMIYELKNKFCLLHDNRIFHFSFKEVTSEAQEAKYEGLQLQELKDPKNPDSPQKSSSSIPDSPTQYGSTNPRLRDPILRVPDAVEWLNDLVTTSKYRAIASLYFPLRVMDYAVLIYFSYVLVTTEADVWKIPLYLIVSLEIFYDVMGGLTKLWPMERVKLFVALSFYFFYFLLFGFLFQPLSYDNYRYLIYWGLLIGRFIAFALELGLDIALDTEIHNDIIGSLSKKGWFEIDPTDELKKLKKHYLGSCSSLLFTPVIEEPTNQHSHYHLQGMFWFVLVLIVWFLVLPLVIFAIFGGFMCFIGVLIFRCRFGSLCPKPEAYLRELYGRF